MTMKEKPTGTLFVRHAGTSGHVGVYGLVSMTPDIAGERMYLGAFQRVDGQLRFGLDPRVVEVPDFSRFPSYTYPLGGLAKSAIWLGGPETPGACRVFVRDAGLAAIHPGKHLYLMVAVVANAQALFAELDDTLVDIRSGVQVGSEPAHSTGMQPDSVLRNPFFLTPDGDRRGMHYTLGPKAKAAMLDLSRITAKPTQELTGEDQDRLSQIERDPYLSGHLLPYRDPAFAAFARQMHAAAPIVGDRLCTAEELRERDALAASVIRNLKLDAVNESCQGPSLS